MSNGADIRDIDALNDLKAAFGRFGEDVTQILASLHKQFEEILERLGEQQTHWQRQTDEAQDEVYAARQALDEAKSSANDEEDGVVDCSYEEDAVYDAEKRLSGCESNLETAKQWRHRIESLIADFEGDFQNLSNLASTRTGAAQAFLTNKNELLEQYVGSGFDRASGLQINSKNDILNKGRSVLPTEQARQQIKKARFSNEEYLGSGINETYLLTGDDGFAVVFKPRDGENQRYQIPGIEPYTLCFREKAASLVDELLGLGLVPPTEIIEFNSRKGSAQIFKNGFATFGKLSDSGDVDDSVIEKLTHRQRQDWQLLDQVIGNFDRNDENWMLRQQTPDNFDLALIDNGFSLAETKAFERIRNPASCEKIDSLNQTRLERFLATETEWRPKLRELISDIAIDQMVKRARDLLKRGYYE